MHRNGAPLLRTLSTVLGWIYVFSWSASFYPQPLLNWRRRSTVGLTIDFPALNVLGFVSYTISTACFRHSPTIRDQYAARHPLSPEPTVRFNDLAFAVHALVLVVLTYSQFYVWIWNLAVSDTQRTSVLTRSIVALSMLSVLSTSVAVVMIPSTHWQWIDVVYIFGYIKLVATFVKYTPQVWHNFKRKSTRGWSIDQILFDCVGGVLSLAQLFLDASFQGDWSGLTGNPTKLCLGLISLCFDLIFISQHYLLYADDQDLDTTRTPDTEDAVRPLLNHAEARSSQHRPGSLPGSHAHA